ncbi:FtsX-like permease family protein [Leifsonia sp. NPDC058230]|uniref:FtsX-like permease family protein n=1 Tax=Leifsonia sp. NPDC058230 TaxID=3346391 RepID=UPI0036DB4768
MALTAGAAIAMSLISAGRSASLAEDVRARIESAEARTIVVQASPADRLTAKTMRPIERVDGLESAVAFGQSTDVSNEALSGGAAVPARRVWTSDWAALGVPAPTSESTSTAWADSSSVLRLGIAAFPAAVRSPSGSSIAIAGPTQVSLSLTEYANGVLIPTNRSRDSEPVTAIVIVAKSADDVQSLLRIVRTTLHNTSSSTIKIRTSSALVEVSGVVRSVLDSYGRNTLVGSFIGAAALVATLQIGVVLAQRRDFGRRRAIGATRFMIAGLVIGHTVTSTGIGILFGFLGSWIYLTATSAAAPPPDLCVAFAVLLLAATGFLAVIPASLAARLNPATEMRVP